MVHDVKPSLPRCSTTGFVLVSYRFERCMYTPVAPVVQLVTSKPADVGT